MDDQKTTCVTCAWRATCNKKFLMDGATTTRCLEYTRDIMLGAPECDTDDKKSTTEDHKNDQSC
jgi:hypothetical protein